MKITKITHGHGETKNIGNYESIRTYNEIEAVLEDGDKIPSVQSKLRKAVEKLNVLDFEKLLGEKS